MRKRKLIIFASVTAAIALLSYLMINRLSQPAQGTLTNPAVIQDTRAKQLLFDYTPRTITSPYVSFTIPTSLTDAPANKLVGSVIEMHNFSYHDTETWNLAITVLNIPSGHITDNSSYAFAHAYPDFYQETQITVNNQPVIVIADKTTGGFKKFAVLVRGSHQAVISLYGDDPSGPEKLQTTFDMILSSWQWLAT